MKGERSTERWSHSRHRRAEGGFTLAEVMVVVLIIGILLAIGIPTFLGARDRAHDLAARTSLDTAVDTASGIILGDLDAELATADANAMQLAEPSLTFLPADQVSNGPEEVSIDVSSPERWIATVRSRSGTCFAAEISSTGTARYGSSDCPVGDATEAGTPTNVATSSAASLSSNWRTDGLGADKLNDGDVDTIAHTDWQNGQSAAFDLGSVQRITEIRLWNRPDCCQSRMKNMWIFVSDDPIPDDLATARASNATSFSIADVIGRPTTVPIDTAGQHVRVFASGPAFHLGEIEIFALP